VARHTWGRPGHRPDQHDHLSTITGHAPCPYRHPRAGSELGLRVPGRRATPQSSRNCHPEIGPVDPGIALREARFENVGRLAICTRDFADTGYPRVPCLHIHLTAHESGRSRKFPAAAYTKDTPTEATRMNTRYGLVTNSLISATCPTTPHTPEDRQGTRGAGHRDPGDLRPGVSPRRREPSRETIAAAGATYLFTERCWARMKPTSRD
jgi:hypothetical protein